MTVTGPYNTAGAVSENSRRIARNTLLLYFRMLLLMFIGLFTSRVVLKSLGVDDYGVYGAVGGIVAMFTVITTSISQSISRYLTVELGRSDMARLKRVFSTAVSMQILFCAVILVLTETLGLWWLNSHMNIPDGRLEAANWVLQCSMGVLMVNLLSVPFNATIIAHERMDAFACISILEAVLKLAVALLLLASGGDKLIIYAALMLAVALVVRMTYGLYCRRHFSESRGRLVFDRQLLAEMTGFAGWNVLGSGSYLFNTQGVNLVANYFFGVGVNAARLVASQVENIVKQFVSNFLTALNPQITKSYATGQKDYCFELVSKGVKFSCLVMLVFLVPVTLEAPALLHLWLGEVPEFAVTFVRLTLFCLMADMMFNPLLTLILADGRIKRYYIVSSAVAILVFALSWLVFALGAQAYWSYVIFALVYCAVDVVKLISAKRLAGFPAGRFLKETVLGVLAVAVISLAVATLCRILVPAGSWRLPAVLAAGWLSLCLSAYSIALTGGEKEFLFHKVARFFPDRLYLRMKYRLVFGERLDLRHPETLSGKIQWLKLYDRNPLYHTLADKCDVKDFVAGLIGEEHIIPTLGVWKRAEDIDFDSLPDRFVLKCTHDSGSAVICRGKSDFDVEAARAGLSAALKADFYKKDREWVYKGLEPRIIAEEYIGDDPLDYKFFCFDGEPRYMFVASDRSSETEETKFDFFDMEFNRLDIVNGHPNSAAPLDRPEHWEEMKSLARTLSAGLRHVRVDLYEIDGQVYFGEYTFYHWGGFVPFGTPEQDKFAGSFLKIDSHG